MPALSRRAGQIKTQAVGLAPGDDMGMGLDFVKRVSALNIKEKYQ
jgi:hypothetical protein